MRRSIEQAFLDLRETVRAWAFGSMQPGTRIFVYPPEWEAPVLARFPVFAEECAAIGCPIALVDAGTSFLEAMERRQAMVERLKTIEAQSTDRVLHDLGAIASRFVTQLLVAPLEQPITCRIIVNTGALATFISYSAITNSIQGDSAADRASGPNVIAFPGEGDERSLNLLRLRVDANYRVPRI